jgi:hypothetical protein
VKLIANDEITGPMVKTRNNRKKGAAKQYAASTSRRRTRERFRRRGVADLPPTATDDMSVGTSADGVGLVVRIL